MRLPLKPPDLGRLPGPPSTDLFGGSAIDSTVHTLKVVVVAEHRELAFKINRVPEQGLVEELPPDSPDESLHERVG